MTKQKRKASTKASRLTRELLETAHDMRATGFLTRAAHEKITMRHKADIPPPVAGSISGSEIRALREQANLSQAVFAKLLNLTVGYVSQLERGAKRPTGATLTLLNVIQRKGIDVVLL
jgi:putative transcriptional regulator